MHSIPNFGPTCEQQLNALSCFAPPGLSIFDQVRGGVLRGQSVWIPNLAGAWPTTKLVASSSVSVQLPYPLGLPIFSPGAEEGGSWGWDQAAGGQNQGPRTSCKVKGAPEYQALAR